jgi:hypothetical protein
MINKDFGKSAMLRRIKKYYFILNLRKIIRFNLKIIFAAATIIPAVALTSFAIWR